MNLVSNAALRKKMEEEVAKIAAIKPKAEGLGLALVDILTFRAVVLNEVNKMPGRSLSIQTHVVVLLCVGWWCGWWWWWWW